MSIVYIAFAYIGALLCVGHTNNVHCLAKAINSLAGAMFTVHGPGDVEMRLKEFLAVRIPNASIYIVQKPIASKKSNYCV